MKSRFQNTIFIILLLALAYLYAGALHVVTRFDLGRPAWHVVLMVNTLLALVVGFTWKERPLSQASLGQRVLAWSLGPLVFLGTLLLISLAAQIKIETHAHGYGTLEIVALCLWVPIVEEIIFRRFASQWLSAHVSGLWAIYLSGLVFALAHTSPPLSPWPPLGAFILGCLCTWAYRTSGRLLAPILLHAACNGSAILFAIYAPSWLDKLSWLYQKL